MDGLLCDECEGRVREFLRSARGGWLSVDVPGDVFKVELVMERELARGIIEYANEKFRHIKLSAVRDGGGGWFSIDFPDGDVYGHFC